MEPEIEIGVKERGRGKTQFYRKSETIEKRDWNKEWIEKGGRVRQRNVREIKKIKRGSERDEKKRERCEWERKRGVKA